MTERSATYRRGTGITLLATMLCGLAFWPPGPAGAQTVREVFQAEMVAKDSPGDQIGLRGSRMIVRIAGQDMPGRLPPGSPVTMSALRAGQALELTGELQ